MIFSKSCLYYPFKRTLKKANTSPKPKLTLTFLQTLALEIHYLAFFYIPKLPIRFTDDFTALKICRSPIQWLFVAVSSAHLLFQGILSGLLAVYYGALKPSEKYFGWERLAILTLACLGFTLATLFGYSILKIRSRLVNSFNCLLKMKRTLVLSGDIKENGCDSDKYGQIMLIITALSGGFPFFITAIALHMNYDTTEYVLRIVLEDPMYWDTKTVYYTLALRTFLLFTVGLEFSRSGSYILCCLFIFGDQGSKVVQCMQNLKVPIFLYLYTLLRIMYGKIRIWFHWFAYLLEATFFWGTVISCYFVIVCWDKVNMAVYMVAFIGVISCVIIQAALLPDAVDAVVLTAKVVEIQKTKVKAMAAQKNRKIKLLNRKTVTAIQPIRVMCGSFKVIDRTFLREHFELLSTRVFDVLMMRF